MRVLLLVFALGFGVSFWFLQQGVGPEQKQRPAPAGKAQSGDNGSSRHARTPGRRIGPNSVPTPAGLTTFDSRNRYHPCVGNRYCLVAYMAPWCPYCKQSLPAYEQMLKMASGTDQLGVTLVLSSAGQGFRGADSLARRISGPVYRDRRDRAWAVVKRVSNGSISGVPAWAIYDADGLLVSSSSGSVSRSSPRHIRRFLNGRMGMQGRLNL